MTISRIISLVCLLCMGSGIWSHPFDGVREDQVQERFLADGPVVEVIRETKITREKENKVKDEGNQLADPKQGETHECTWLGGRYGKTMNCPSGYVATGACGSGSRPDCGRGIWTKMRCCKVDGFANSGCTSRSYRYGKNGHCPSGKFINSLCGSGRNADCGYRAWFAIGCCDMPGYTITPSTCSWEYGGPGSHLSCPTKHVMTGRCGSGGNADCFDGHNRIYRIHGIYCCAYRSTA